MPEEPPTRPGRTPRVTDEEVLAVFADATDPVLTTTEVAAQVPIGKRAVLNRLNALHDQGRVRRKAVGPRGQVWWVPGVPVPRADGEAAGGLAVVGFPTIGDHMFAQLASGTLLHVDAQVQTAIEEPDTDAEGGEDATRAGENESSGVDEP